VGEPDFDTPDCIKEACFRAIREGRTHYTHSLGLIELREAIADDYWKRYRVKISPEQILIASGTSPAFVLLFSALLEPGDEIILSNPIIPVIPISFALLMAFLSLWMSWKRKASSIFRT